MDIDKNALIAGVPVSRIRTFFRANRGRSWHGELMRDALDVAPDVAIALIRTLHDEDYIEPVDEEQEPYPKPGAATEKDHIDGPLNREWRMTMRGNALANVSFTARVTRKTAENALREFLDRVDELNGDDRWLMKVERVVLFGSYLDPDVDRLGDVDLAVEFVRKDAAADKWMDHVRNYVRREQAEGRRFRTYFDELSAPEMDSWKYLKKRSRTLKLHSIDDSVWKSVRHEVIVANGQRQPSAANY